MSAVPGATVRCTLQNPVARKLAPAGPFRVQASVRKPDGSSITTQQIDIALWPHRICLNTSGLAFGAYEFTLRGLSGKLDVRIPLTLKAWVAVDARDVRRCRVAGLHRFRTYPRSVGREVAILRSGARLSFTTYGRAIYLRLPMSFQTPGPYYGSFLDARLRWRIDSGKWRVLEQAAEAREVMLADSLKPGEHTVDLEPLGESCGIEGFRVSAKPLTRIQGTIVAGQFHECLTDVRVDALRGDRIVRSAYVRNPPNSRFVLVGLPPGRYDLRFSASGWESELREGVELASDGAVLNAGVIAFRREQRFAAVYSKDQPCFGRTMNVQPGGTFVLKGARGRLDQPAVFLESRFKRVALTAVKTPSQTSGPVASPGEVRFRVPVGTPEDMYDLLSVAAFGGREWERRFGQAVCVRKRLPGNFHAAGCGHMNTWGQKTSEYLGKVGEMAQLAGARVLLVSNEVNAAYVCGGLDALRIPYLVTQGNHTMSRWDGFFSKESIAYDDGPMRVVTFGHSPRRSWKPAEELFRARPDATNRIVLCYEHYAPLAFIRDNAIDLLFDGHSTGAHPEAARFPEGTLGFRAPIQEMVRWIPMTPDGFPGHIRSAKQVPNFVVPREGPAPLHATFDGPNDGSRSRLAARVSNGCGIPFDNGRLRFLLKKGAYRVRGGKLLQSFESDNGKVTVVDVEAAFPARKETTVKVESRDASTP